MPPSKIVVLTHLRQGLQVNSMVGRLIRQVWRPAGIEVVVQQGLKNPPQADLAIMHVDLTVVPPEYIALGASYPRCLNLAVTDISKRRISRSLVQPGDDYRGAVIVKADKNWGGRQERALRLAEGGLWRRLADRLSRKLPAAWTGRLPDDRYLVLASKRDVPGWVWRSSDLVVERLAVERHGENYVMHQWYFFGGSDCVCSIVGADAFITFEQRVALLPLHRDVPQEIRRRRDELGFDFGKFDYVVTEEGPVLFDANRTPAIDEPELGRTAMLAQGLESFQGMATGS